MKHFLMALIIGFFMVGTASSADINQYIGTWTNIDRNTRGITKMVFGGDGGGKINVHVWGKCSPQDCDWGWKSCNSHYDGHLFAQYRNNVSVTDLTMNMTNISTLAVKANTRYTDNSGRPPRENMYTLRRLVIQQQTPQPMNQAIPKPMDWRTPPPVTNQPTGKY